jgi:octaheme c-type cytochrome (tetrathionate reductase family)
MRNKIAGLLLCFLTLFFLSLGAANATDHTFIEGPLANGTDVTKTCLECHENAAFDIMKTSHWTWSSKQTVDGKQIQRGKINTINNFCISIRSNEARCTSCHIGYGWKDDNFDFSDPTKVDCLVCHDTTGDYKKSPAGAGLPYEHVDLLHVARHVGKTSRQSCGTCHFYGGGGDAVKQGDLDSSMANPSRELDVHMATDGNNFNCSDCHKTKAHNINGNAMVVSPEGHNSFSCIDCHGKEVHDEALLNRHIKTVACQTCHIPTFAREIPTKISWDWSKAGSNMNSTKDKYGKTTFINNKGLFVWDKNVIPEYLWYDGTASVYHLGDKIDPTKITYLSQPNGDREDMNSRIYPFKLHSGKQPYDSQNMYLITPQLYGDNGYWKTYDWNDASARGMAKTGLKYSGQYDFAPTAMYWRITHMVAPKEKALNCLNCHGEKSRLNWKQLGYKGDPLSNNDYSRIK